MVHVAVPVSAAYKTPNKKGKKAIAAAATARKKENACTAKGGSRGGAHYELPNGHWFSKGTCHFTHDKLNPGGPCYRDPRWGPLPDKVLKNKQQVERIKSARENNAKRLQVANLPICSAMASPEIVMQAMDVNGCGANFTWINAVSGVDEKAFDDQGECT
eukprot:2568463-Pleurochrysis_carterae.AAC.1